MVQNSRRGLRNRAEIGALRDRKGSKASMATKDVAGPLDIAGILAAVIMVAAVMATATILARLIDGRCQ